MRIAIQHYGTSNINAVGGGEWRWAANWKHVLQSWGHEVEFVPPGSDQGFDLYLDAPTDNCSRLRATKHAHTSFSGHPSVGWQAHFECFGSDACFIAHPYRQVYKSSSDAALTIPGYTPLFLPTPYPDSLLPKLSEPFERKGILWATKDPFHPLFLSPESERHFIPKAGVSLLRALGRLSQHVDFDMHVVMSDHLQSVPSTWGIKKLLANIPNKTLYPRALPWNKLVHVMSQAKLNVPVSQLEGSRMESIFCHTVSVAFATAMRNVSACDGTIYLQDPYSVTEAEYYDALTAFWLNRELYQKAQERAQNFFQDHRDAGIARAWQTFLERIGV